MDDETYDPEPAPDPAPDQALDRRAELSEFLRTRRARLRPEDVGLPRVGRHRRVPGLRREELAQLAGVSVAYYTRLEQGQGRNVSAQVLEAIARALRLTDAERAHLTHLARPAPRSAKRPPARPQRVREAVQQLLDAVGDVPAYVTGRRTDILAWNRMAALVFDDWGALPPRERNWARLVFLHSAVYRERYLDWDSKTADIVSFLRLDAGQHPEDPQLAALVGELSVKSEEFRGLWAAHDVKDKGHGVKRMRHPVAGELTLSYETLRLPEDADQMLVLYYAEPGSPSADALRLLSSWGADAAAAPGHGPAPGLT